jgi:hypothetical protein
VSGLCGKPTGTGRPCRNRLYFPGRTACLHHETPNAREAAAYDQGFEHGSAVTSVELNRTISALRQRIQELEARL